MSLLDQYTNINNQNRNYLKYTGLRGFSDQLLVAINLYQANIFMF